jgi:hypothetical protein
MKIKRREGLGFIRFMMVLSSISPLFILWAIRGNTLVSDKYFLLFCSIMVIVPNIFLGLRIWTTRKLQEKRDLVVGKTEDHRDHLLVYLFAMLLPIYAVNFNSWRELSAALAAVGFIVFLFWHLNLHYMNLIFAILGYRVFSVFPQDNTNPLSGRDNFVLISRRTDVQMGERLTVYRISDTVYLEVNK